MCGQVYDLKVILIVPSVLPIVLVLPITCGIIPPEVAAAIGQDGTTMCRPITAALMLIALSACVSPEEERTAQLNQDRQTCTAYGLTLGTPQFAECMMRLGEQRAVTEMVYRQNASRLGAQLLNGQPAF